jgi:hypothetical protein
MAVIARVDSAVIARGGHDEDVPRCDHRLGGNNSIAKQKSKTKNKSAKPRWPLERSIPEFPTKVGGHHVTKSTDLARDSSLKDR